MSKKHNTSDFQSFALYYFIGVAIQLKYLVDLSTLLHFQCRNAQKTVDSKKNTIDLLSTYRLID